MSGYRDLLIGTPEPFFRDNTISTTKYTLITFLPLNLIQQFMKIANLYFLFLCILQMIPNVTISNRIPTILPPLAFIVFLSMIKDAFEDYKRYKSDNEENTKQCFVYRNKKFVRADWKDVNAGDLIKVNKDSFFPADLILLASSEFRKGQCFIETKNLDGETNLKSKQVPDDIKAAIHNEDDVDAANRGCQVRRRARQRRRPEPVPLEVQGYHRVPGKEDPAEHQQLPAERLHPPKRRVHLRHRHLHRVAGLDPDTRPRSCSTQSSLGPSRARWRGKPDKWLSTPSSS